MQKSQIIGFFVESRLHWQLEVLKNFYKQLFKDTYLFIYK